MSLPIKLANDGLRNLLITLGTIFFATIALIDIGMYFIVIRPLRKVSQSADRISTGVRGLCMKSAPSSTAKATSASHHSAWVMRGCFTVAASNASRETPATVTGVIVETE